MAAEELEGQAMAMRADTSEVTVKTALGPRTYRTPRNMREVEQSEERDAWMLALQKAVDAILKTPRNRLVRKSVGEASGRGIANCVVVFKIKTDKDTGALDGNNAFKARCCYDDSKIRNIAKARERAEMVAKYHQQIAVKKAERVAEPFSSVVADDILIKALFAVAATGRTLTKADVKDAYSKGIRSQPPSYMYMPRLMQEYADDGEELIFELGSPLWGEQAAGRDWQDTLHAELIRLGWKACEDVPAMYRYVGESSECVLITIVDDLLFSESEGYEIASATITGLKKAFGEVTSEREPTSFAGYKVTRDWERHAITLSMPETIEAMAREHYPHFLDGKPAGMLKGKELRDTADSLEMPPAEERARKLDKVQSKTRSVTGSLKYQERKVKPILSLAVHRLSCVTACPPLAAARVAEAVAWQAWETRFDGITFGGEPSADLTNVQGAITTSAFSMDDGAPEWLHTSADAAWRGQPTPPADVLGIIVTLNRAAIYHSVKKVSLILNSSHEIESIGSGKGAEVNTIAREIMRAHGKPMLTPTEILCDNQAHVSLANKRAWPSASRTFLRRYHALLERIEAGEATVVKVSDEENPADFLTKWVPVAKLRRSVDYATNAKRACAASRAPR